MTFRGFKINIKKNFKLTKIKIKIPPFKKKKINLFYLKKIKINDKSLNPNSIPNNPNQFKNRNPRTTNPPQPNLKLLKQTR